MSLRPYNLFISYAHKNEAVKDRLLGHLKLLKRSGLVRTWDDREIPAGADWRAQIESAMAAADAALFLLDEYFLASDFCLDVEVEGTLRRHRQENVLILFVLTDHCMWEEIEYIERTQLLPRDARPIIDFDPPSKAYTAVAREIKTALLAHRERPGLPDRPTAPAPVPELETPETAALDLTALLANLPGQTDHLFGRRRELQLLDGWHSRSGVFLWVAPGAARASRP